LDFKSINIRLGSRAQRAVFVLFVVRFPVGDTLPPFLGRRPRHDTTAHRERGRGREPVLPTRPSAYRHSHASANTNPHHERVPEALQIHRFRTPQSIFEHPIPTRELLGTFLNAGYSPDSDPIRNSSYRRRNRSAPSCLGLSN
jgi:hypothetical protein